MTFIQALFIGLLQGATELFPVSSLGHAVVVPALLRWSYKESDPSFVPFLTLLHLGTATALVVVFWHDWVRIVRGFVSAGMRGAINTPDERLAMLLATGTVPAGVLGVFFETPLKHLFASPLFASSVLILNGVILLGAERLRRRDEARTERDESDYTTPDKISFGAALIVGACQSLALLPGLSRSGVTIAGGLVAGLRHQEAARFSFLLATPVIAAAGVAEVPKLAGESIPLTEYLIAAALAGIAAYFSATFLVRYFKSGRLDPYGWYCIAAGLVSTALLLLFR